ncbi:MAG: DUF5808 domain-containing protein [Acidobacteria bacterium]|nr:DUF5808 domain-containing protein [Acidobacteriota bacterium]
MEALTVWIVLVVETIAAGGFMLLIPKITRRGLLFGVYVGEARSTSDQARAITQGWYVVMVAALAASVVLGVGLALRHPHSPKGAFVPLFVLLGTTVASYLWAHIRSRALAAPGAPVSAAAFVIDQPQSLTIPLIATAVALVGGAMAVGYAWWHFADMPASIPTHFGASGRPDAWSPRSFRSVMVLPILTLVVCPTLGLMACLTARAKRAIRQSDHGVSFDAQIRFRRAMTLFLSGTVVLVTLMLTMMSIGAVRVALGLAERLSVVGMGMTAALVIYALGGALYLMLHFGQGGARLERSASGAPLTNGLADNTHWVLGMFYVNRDDPSIFVEKRFGMGYTINLGNPAAVACIAAFFIILGAVLGISLSMPQSHAPVR